MYYFKFRVPESLAQKAIVEEAPYAAFLTPPTKVDTGRVHPQKPSWRFEEEQQKKAARTNQTQETNNAHPNAHLTASLTNRKIMGFSTMWKGRRVRPTTGCKKNIEPMKEKNEFRLGSIIIVEGTTADTTCYVRCGPRKCAQVISRREQYCHIVTPPYSPRKKPPFIKFASLAATTEWPRTPPFWYKNTF